MKVVLDAGHGGKDPGAIGNGLQEKDFTLSISKEIGRILQSQGVEAHYTRTTDTFLELKERADIANNLNADLFLSVHINAAENLLARGVETFHYPNSKEGQKLASDIQDELVKSKIFTMNRGAKDANFAVLRHTKMPAALVELGFITNPVDANLLRDSAMNMAYAVALGILVYLKIPYKESQDVIDGEIIFNKLQAYLNSLKPSDYAIEANKKAVQKGIYADGDGDGLIDIPRGYMTREQVALVLMRLGLLD